MSEPTKAVFRNYTSDAADAGLRILTEDNEGNEGPSKNLPLR